MFRTGNASTCGGSPPSMKTCGQSVGTAQIRPIRRPRRSFSTRLNPSRSAIPDHRSANACDKASRTSPGTHPDLDPEPVARRLVAVWDGLQAQWLVTPDFDLADEILASFRQLSGQNVMEAKVAFERAIAAV